MSDSVIRTLLKNIGNISESIYQLEKKLDDDTREDKEELLEKKLELENKLDDLEQELMEYMI